MAGYTELIKNFEKIRVFARDFFIYGFKGRSHYSTLSPRSYDNERRRIESYLSDLIVRNRDKNGKTISISSNTTAKTSNPLFKVWQTKSFTKNDCFLHFVILDILSVHDQGLGVGEIAEIISKEYTIEANIDYLIDSMTIRNKLNEYTKLGILKAKKCGKALYYSLESNPLSNLTPSASEGLANALSYYNNVLPAGFIGHSMGRLEDSPFIYRQIFFAQIFDDELLLQILNAIGQKRIISLLSNRNDRDLKNTVIPLKILSNTKTGRRYLAVLYTGKRKYATIRLDSIKSVSLGDICQNYDSIKEAYEAKLQKAFSIIHQGNERLHWIKVLLSINEATEQYVLERIRREGKHGVITKTDKDTFEYSIEVADTLEMVPWLRTFIGRIIKIEGTEAHIIAQFNRDIDTLASMYREI